MLWAGGCITEDYVAPARAWLASLRHLTGCGKFLVTVNFDWPHERPPGVEFLRLGLAGGPCEPDYVCLQYGGFLPALEPLRPDVVLLADVDGVFQRDFSAPERLALEGVGDDEALMGFNDGPCDDGAREHARLEPAADLEAVGAVLGYRPAWIPVRNGGLIGMRPSAWGLLAAEYAALWPRFAPLYRNKRKTQLLLCACARRLLFTAGGFGYVTHSHGHFALSADHAFAPAGVLLYRGETVLFAHNVEGRRAPA